MPHSLPPPFLAALTFTEDQLSTLRALGEHRGRQQLFTRQTPEVLESLRRVAVVESSESSNRIEGIVAPRKRVEALVLRSTTPKNRSEQEIAGYRDALNLIHESHEHMPFSTNIVLQLHSMVYRYLPADGGRWKGSDNQIVERDADGNVTHIRFAPTPAFQTPMAMDDLVARYLDAADAQGKEPLIVVPLAILDFLCVHPFRDGNGRVSRLLTLLLLYRHGYDVGRWISLERIFEESKATYYEVLEASSQGWHEGEHDVFPWLNYFWGTLLRAYAEFEERVGTVGSGRGSKTDLVRAAVQRRIAPFAISDVLSDCPGVSRDMVRVVLRQLRDEGAIELRGRGRGAKWLRVKNLEN